MKQQTPRVVLVGNSAVGKTTLATRMCTNKPPVNPLPTISCAFLTLRGTPPHDDLYAQIWDTAGAEKYRAVNSSYYHSASGGILLFDLTNKSSFDELDSWLTEFTDHAPAGALKILVGNKSDLYDSTDERVAIDDAQRWADKNELKLFCTSAQTGDGIPELIDFLLTSVPQHGFELVPRALDTISVGRDRAASSCC